MDSISLSKQVEDRYRQYLNTMFYFREPEFRASFESALAEGHLTKGPYLEATPVFRRGSKPSDLLSELLDTIPDDGFLAAVKSERRMYLHQEESIRNVFNKRNVVVARKSVV